MPSSPLIHTANRGIRARIPQKEPEKGHSRGKIARGALDANTLAKLSDAISAASSSRIWLSGGAHCKEPLGLACVIDSLRELRAAAGVRIDVAPSILDRLAGETRPRNPSEVWICSRAALAEVWRLAMQASPKAIGLSLSHSKEAWLAAARAVFDFEEAESAGVGADVEAIERPISDRLLKRFQNDDDAWTGMGRIALWTAKEALYKADQNSHGKTLIDYSIRLKENRGMIEGEGSSPDGKSYAACLLGIGVNILGVAAEIKRPMR